jgi:uncharacterized repeat protein (TIGR01451 family)
MFATDAESDPLTYTATGATHGTLSSPVGDKVTYTSDAGYSGPASFTFKANDGLANSNSATVSITVIASGGSPPPPPPPAQADLSATLTGTPATVDIGDLVTYTATVHNNGSATATGVTLTDAFPSVLAFTSATSTQGTCERQTAAPKNVVCTIGTLANGASATVVIKAHPTASGVVTNAVLAKGDQADPVSANDTAVVSTTVRSPAAGGSPPPPPASPPPPPPPPGTKTPPNCVVPNLVGQKLAAAKRKLTAAHCKLGKVKKAYSTRVGKGKVQSQSPKARKQLKNGAPVSVVVSRGPRRKK